MLKQRQRTIVLIVIAALLAPIAVLRIWNSQFGYLYQTQKHIARITPEWEEFQRTNKGFERVHLFAYTGGDGMFGAYGDLWSDADLVKLRTFMERTKPPRPMFLGAVRVFVLKETDMKSVEPGAAANGSQPLRPETNRTSSAAGSRR